MVLYKIAISFLKIFISFSYSILEKYTSLQILLLEQIKKYIFNNEANDKN